MSDETRIVTDHEKAILDRVKRLAERADPEHVEAAVSFTRQNLAALAALPVATAGPDLREAVTEWLAAEDERAGQWNAAGACGHDDPHCPEMEVIRETGDASYERQKAAIESMRAALRGAAAQADGGEPGLERRRRAEQAVIEAARELNMTMPDFGDGDPLSDLDDALGELDAILAQILAARLTDPNP